MKQVILINALLGLILYGVCAAEDKVEMKDEKAKISYSAGYRLGSDFKKQFGAVDARAMVKGVQDALLDATPLDVA